ncbi:MAG: protein kinase domain-containing protein [Blastocatellia bacterium]
MSPEQWQQVERLYHAALELPASARGGFLATSCGADLSLRREIESLLACDDQAGAFLEKPAREIVAARLGQALAPTNGQHAQPGSALRPGMQLGSYEITGSLGVGGMGEVYRARDLRLGREVAIKVLPASLSRDPDRVNRFEREARLLAALNHPNIAAIYDLAQADGKRFLVLELVPGVTLAERIKNGPLPMAEALPVFRQIAAALRAAHTRDIIHRDLKPANIHITPDGTVKALDFGIAKTIRTANTTLDSIDPESPTLMGLATVSDTLTRAGTIIGTVAYLSPEQARGHDDQLTPRADLWAWGCVLFESLTGRQPFTGRTIGDTLGAILSAEPDWKLLPKNTPASVQYLLRRCLDKDPAGRPESAAEIIGALDATMTGTVSPGPAMRLMQLRLNRTRWRASAVLAAMLALICGFGVWQYARERAVRAAIPGKKYVAIRVFGAGGSREDDEAFRTGLAQYLSASLARVEDLQVVTPSPLESDVPRDPDNRWLVNHLGANLILGGAVTRENGRIRVSWSLVNKDGVNIGGDSLDGNTGDVLRLQDQIAARVARVLRVPEKPGPGDAASQELREPAAQEHYLQALGYLQRDLDGAAIDKAIELLEGLSGAGQNSALVLAALGKAYLFRHNLTLDDVWVRRADDVCQKALQLAPDLPEARVTLGFIHNRRGQYKQAISVFEQALARKPDEQDALQGLADAYAGNNELKKAGEILHSARMRRPDYWAVQSELGFFYWSRGEYEKALEPYRRVVELLPNSESAYTNLGNVYYSQGKLDEAMTAYNKSLELHPTAAAYAGQGTVLFYRGKYAEAADTFRRAVALNENDAGMWGNLGDALRWTSGAADKAAEAYDKAIQLRRQNLAPDPEDLGRLAEWQAKRGRLAESLAALKQALGQDVDNPYCMASATVVYHLAGDRAQALQWARRAIRAGYSLTEIESEPELRALREDPAFIAFARQFRKQS